MCIRDSLKAVVFQNDLDDVLADVVHVALHGGQHDAAPVSYTHLDWRGDCTLSEFHELDAGFDYYAPQSFVDGNGRRIQIGWMGITETPLSLAWLQCHTISSAVSRSMRWFHLPTFTMASSSLITFHV